MTVTVEPLILGSICQKITKGTTPTKKMGGYSKSGVNYIKSESLSYTGHIDTGKFAKIPKSVNAILKRSQISEGDILYSIAGVNLGKCGIATKEMLPANTNQAVAIIRVDPTLADASYVQFALRNPILVNTVLAGVSQSAQPNVNLRDISNFEIPNFTLCEQRRISSLLSSLDDKIELNRQMNEVLEGMARAVFRDWFVDFGPTRRKMAGEGDPVKILGGAISAPPQVQKTAALFPDRLGENGLPEGWEMGTLGDFAMLNPESWSAKRHPDRVSYVDLANTKWGNIQETTEYEWQDAPSRARRVIIKGDTIVGTVRPGNGSYSFVGFDGLTASTGFAVLRPMKTDFEEFVYCASTSSENIENLTNLADGGAYPAVRPDVVLKTVCAVPDERLVSMFSLFGNPIFQKMEQAKEENQTLAEMRDLVLPKLMSGEIRLREGG